MPNHEAPECRQEAIHEETVARVRAAMPDNTRFYALSVLYKMFADNTRLRILWALCREEMCVCDLAALLGMTKSAISHQLKSLRMANLVRFERQGKNVCYALADAHVRDIFERGFAHISE